MSGRPCFQIGLTMAGAVSAGAYTAGVIDFLLEALDAIEDVREKRTDRIAALNAPEFEKCANPVIDVPHDVRIAALSGTSAGSMVTAILATVLGTRIEPVSGAGPKPQRTGNPLYDAWVNDIHYDKLLSTTDLDKGQQLVSLLNSDALQVIVNKTLTNASRNDYPRPYVVEGLPIYFCTSNLRGVRYSLQMGGDRGLLDEYQMSMHADHMGFVWPAAGKASPDLVELVPGAPTPNWRKMGDAALASGAFPVGLKPRILQRPFRDYEIREWLIPGAPTKMTRRHDPQGNPLQPDSDPNSWDFDLGGACEVPPLDTGATFPKGYEFVNVDGGIFDNEPLELARQALAGVDGHNPRDERIADRSIILIDPFPNLFPLDKDYDADKQTGLLAAIKSVLPAILAQGRFKLDELVLAKDPNVASRHAIMPVRYESSDPHAPPAKYAIACGSLGGFGGFLSKEFRHHDYTLGRRNCQSFLAHHFILPADFASDIVNPLFEGWKEIAGDVRGKFEVEDVFKYQNGEQKKIKYLPVVPLLGKLACPDYTAMPAWPDAPADLNRDALTDALVVRADAVVKALVNEYKPALWLKVAIGVVWWWYKRRWIQDYAIAPIEKALDEHGIVMHGSA